MVWEWYVIIWVTSGAQDQTDYSSATRTNRYSIKALPNEINLPANVIRDLGDKRLLTGRMTDICIIDLEKYYSGQPDYYSIIGRSRGFTGNDCQDNGIARDAGGKWWILSSDKLIRFDPEKIVKNEYPPMSHLTLVEFPGDTSDWVTAIDSSLYYEKEEQADHIQGRQNSIRISYTGISTRNPEDVTFRYRMKGLGDTWSKRTKERSGALHRPPSRQIHL
ncbi:MAG: hypothetical protein U5L72_17375 [Bacteroidales bacterium]|nr:hypothetical protein [Bacteroidales bacterium]